MIRKVKKKQFSQLTILNIHTLNVCIKKKKKTNQTRHHVLMLIGVISNHRIISFYVYLSYS